jgi:hypothetical protein
MILFFFLLTWATIGVISGYLFTDLVEKMTYEGKTYYVSGKISVRLWTYGIVIVSLIAALWLLEFLYLLPI